MVDFLSRKLLLLASKSSRRLASARDSSVTVIMSLSRLIFFLVLEVIPVDCLAIRRSPVAKSKGSKSFVKTASAFWSRLKGDFVPPRSTLGSEKNT